MPVRLDGTRTGGTPSADRAFPGCEPSVDGLGDGRLGDGLGDGGLGVGGLGVGLGVDGLGVDGLGDGRLGDGGPATGVRGDGGPGAGAADTGATSNAGQPKRDASNVARSPPALDQPTMASTWLFSSAVE